MNWLILFLSDLEVIGIFTSYCTKYDIQINAKKTSWMKMGDSVGHTTKIKDL